jgi:hypothetical protein
MRLALEAMATHGDVDDPALEPMDGEDDRAAAAAPAAVAMTVDDSGKESDIEDESIDNMTLDGAP